MGNQFNAVSKNTESSFKTSHSYCQKPNDYLSNNSTADYILNLQRSIGNQAVQRLLNSGVIQGNLKIGKHNDIYKQEADRIAEQVVNMPEPRLNEKKATSVQRQSPQIQCLCSECEDDLQRQEEKKIQPKRLTIQTPEVTSDLESRIRALWGSGQLLPEAQRSFMERRFGVNFVKVRVHTNSNAAQMARELNAEAFTHDKDVYFGAGKYNPGSTVGNRLIAHELTHVVQQGGVSLERFPDYNAKCLQRKDKFHIQPAGKAFTIQRTIIPIKLPSGKNIQVDCKVPSAPKTCNVKYIKPAKGGQKTACISALKAAMADSGVKKIMGTLTKLKGCSIPTIDCKNCTGSCKGAGAWHFPKANAIYICADRNPTNAYAIEYVKHELTHKLQVCRKAPNVTCIDGMKREIEAYKAAGRNFEKSFSGAVWSTCYTKRCNSSHIDDILAAQMKIYYDSL